MSRSRTRMVAAVVAVLTGVIAVAAGAGAADIPGTGNARDIVGTEKKLYSQKNEELVIRDFFQDRRDGFYLDVGCAWPERNSTTYYLEKHLGWTGIGVDAVAEYAPEWAKLRPRSKFFNLLVSDHSGTDDTFYRADWTGVSSIDEEQVKQWKVDYQEIKVRTTTLNKLLDDNGVKKVDFLSMDIEGAQLAALAGFDIERFRPELACVEDFFDGRDEIFKYFDTHGYETIMKYREHDSVNWYFRPKASVTPAGDAQ